MISIQQVFAVIIVFLYIVLMTSTYFFVIPIRWLVLALSLLLLTGVVLLLIQNKENFFFEVSPERKKCLVEQVSRADRNRSPGCCNVGAVGGILPYYRDWITPDTFSGDWKRTDNLTLDRDDPGLKNQLPPLEYVKSGHGF